MSIFVRMDIRSDTMEGEWWVQGSPDRQSIRATRKTDAAEVERAFASLLEAKVSVLADMVPKEAKADADENSPNRSLFEETHSVKCGADGSDPRELPVRSLWAGEFTVKGHQEAITEQFCLVLDAPSESGGEPGFSLRAVGEGENMYGKFTLLGSFREDQGDVLCEKAYLETSRRSRGGRGGRRGRGGSSVSGGGGGGSSSKKGDSSSGGGRSSRGGGGGGRGRGGRRGRQRSESLNSGARETGPSIFRVGGGTPVWMHTGQGAWSEADVGDADELWDPLGSREGQWMLVRGGGPLMLALNRRRRHLAVDQAKDVAALPLVIDDTLGPEEIIEPEPSTKFVREDTSSGGGGMKKSDGEISSGGGEFPSSSSIQDISSGDGEPSKIQSSGGGSSSSKVQSSGGGSSSSKVQSSGGANDDIAPPSKSSKLETQEDLPSAGTKRPRKSQEPGLTTRARKAEVEFDEEEDFDQREWNKSRGRLGLTRDIESAQLAADLVERLTTSWNTQGFVYMHGPVTAQPRLIGAVGASWVAAHRLPATAGPLAGEVYEGEMRGGMPHGYGTVAYQTGLMYEGGFADGRECGWGVLSDSADRVLFHGEVVNGQPTNIGRVFLPDGSVYSGGLRDGLPHGPGSLRLPDGSEYVGQWSEGRRSGNGRFRSHGFEYKGEWKQGLRHGEGTLKGRDGVQYSGAWEHGQPDGKGILKYGNGTEYEGTFKAGLREGRGTLTIENMVDIGGRWVADEPHSAECAMHGPTHGHDGAWLIPFSLQQSIERVHLRAGFDESGK